MSSSPAPEVHRDRLRLSVSDPDRALRGVRLVHELGRPRRGPEFLRYNGNDQDWQLMLGRPPVDRLEYQLELVHQDGTVETICDPGNPLRASGPFGEKSVVEFAEYSPPAWIVADPAVGGTLEAVTTAIDGVPLGVGVWSPAGVPPTTALPLVVAHDGPELVEYSLLLRWVAWAVGAGHVPALRVALIPPPQRDDDYSASPSYARGLGEEVLPALRAVTPSTRVVGMGVSLGALAMLHAHTVQRAGLEALFLMSGSFFRGGDTHEAQVRHFARIAAYVEDLCSSARNSEAIPVAMTCGTVEENLPGNRVMAEALAAQGYPVSLSEHRDGHNWVGWRDTLHPHLTDLLAAVLG